MVREDDLRATFKALHAEGTPPRPFEAHEIIRRGTERRRIRRGWAAIGTGVATAAAVVAVALLLPPRAPEPVLPADPPLTTTSDEPLSSTPPEPPTSITQTPPSSPATTR